MKTIVVPTDFSTAADHAAEYAAALASQINASVTVMHVYQMPVTMTDIPVLMVSTEDMKSGVDKGLQRVKETVTTRYPNVPLRAESRMGEVAEEVEDLCREGEVFALVAGVKGLHGFERFLFGSTTLSLVKKCSYPVIAVPEGAPLTPPKNIALAIDFLNLSDIPAQKIAAVVAALGATLHVIHVETANDRAGDPAPLLAALQISETGYHVVKENNVTQGIRQFAERHQIDMVIVLPHKHSLMERLFSKGHTAGILQAMPVPVMTLQTNGKK